MYINKGVAEKGQVFYRIEMKNPCAEMINCDFNGVAKLQRCLLAIQVCPDSDPVWTENPSGKGSENFVSPMGEANSVEKTVERMVKPSSKQVPRTTALLSVAQRKITSRRRIRSCLAGPEFELKSILYVDEKQTGFRDVERSSLVQEQEEEAPSSLSSSPLCLEELQEPTPGWPLLRKAVPVSQEALRKSEARELSVVQWVMSLPNRSSSVIMQADQNQENDNSVAHNECEIERTSAEVVQTTDDKSMNVNENTENQEFDHLIEYKQQFSLGWPLLQKTASATPEAPRESESADEESVVQWVMNLPDRYQISTDSNPIESTLERETNDSEVNTNNISPPELPGKLPNNLDHLVKTNSCGCRWFSYEELKGATSQFSSENLVGEGGCSSVYKGHLPSGQLVAVKMSKSYKEAWNNFSQEININTSLNHKNIAPLIGVCVEDNHLISVYDFLPKGSLEDNIHGDTEKNQALPWEVRFKVAVVVAEALTYLHEECSPPVIHRDIKSSNILLSDDFQPQLSDFGLAILGPADSTEMLETEDVVGTFGYIAPEYFMHGRVTDKIDIYSFGIVLLELVSGRRPILAEGESLVKWAKPILDSGELNALVDPDLDGKFDRVEMDRVVLAATYCINESDELRPRGSQILKLLRGEKDGEEWFNEMHGKVLKQDKKREDVEFDLQLVMKPLLDGEGGEFILNDCVQEPRRRRCTLRECLEDDKAMN